jgi:hypothetical protein
MVEESINLEFKHLRYETGYILLKKSDIEITGMKRSVIQFFLTKNSMHEKFVTFLV